MTETSWLVLIQTALNELKEIPWFQPDGNPDPAWRLSPTRREAWNASLDATRGNERNAGGAIMTDYTCENLLAAFKAGQRNFVGVDLRGADLSGANLREAALRGANLIEANLYGADLSEADLRRADLYGANLYGANLSEANLYGADLSEADLRGANLSEANLYGANLSEANLRRANLYGADLRGADLSEADLRGANLSEANLRRADLYGANLIDCLGLYGVRPPFMSSRNDALYAGVFEHDGGLVLLFSTGCQRQQTAAELREKVRETHGVSAHAVQYEAAITFIEFCFASDMAEGRFAVKEVQP